MNILKLQFIRKFKKESKKGFHDFPFSSLRVKGIDEHYMYCYNSCTNWSLNPAYVNSFGTRIHTIEGFRKTEDYDSLESYVNEYRDRKVIYCMGDSTTYCYDMEINHNTWPSILKHELEKKDELERKYLVINAGVGGWNMMQSLTRLIAWGPDLKPDFVVIYQSKNELTPLCNVNFKEKRVFPDFSNVMRSVSKENLVAKVIGPSVYGPNIVPDSKGLERFDEKLMNSTLFKYQISFEVSNKLGAHVIFIPEIISSSSVYYYYMEDIHREIEKICNDNSDVSFFDMRKVISFNKKHFSDKMHFSKLGCRVFSESLAKFIIEK